MKLLVKLIDSCQRCDHSTNNSKHTEEWFCGKAGETLGDWDTLATIPDFCPLPDGRREED